MVAGFLVSAAVGVLTAAHPLHTTATELRDSGGVTTIQIRVFEDDLLGALALMTQPDDSAMSRYLRDRFSISEPSGRPVPLRWEAAERTGGVILVRLRATLQRGLAGAKIRNSLLCDRFPDQVNLVRASYGGGTEMLLFTPDDAAKALP